MKRLALIGLGNPGSRKTRHSVGHWFVHRFAQHLGLVAQRMADSTNGDLDGGSTAHNSKLHAMNFVEDKSLKCSVADAGGQVDPRFLCLMSSTYMNTSGTAAKLVVNKLNFEPRQLCVVCDDIDMPFGKVKFRAAGSARGHNGIRSVMSSLNTKEFSRILIGVGRPPPRVTVSDHVLSNFTSTEVLLLRDQVFPLASALAFEALERLQDATFHAREEERIRQQQEAQAEAYSRRHLGDES